MEQKNVLYCIFGASGSGKTTLLQNLVYVEGICGSVQKYSTREERAPTVLNGKMIPDDAIHVSQEELEQKCDIIYESNGYQYGFSTEIILRALNEKDIIIVLSDIRAIKLLKEKIGRLGYETRAIYLSSKMESPQQFLKVWQKRLVADEKECKNHNITLDKSYKEIIDYINKRKRITRKNLVVDTCNFGEELRTFLPQSDTYKRREEKIRLMYTRYIQNIGLFDHVILNYGQDARDMIKQGVNIISYNRFNRRSKPKGPVIFILCASPKSGKGTLMENLNIMGASKIQITPKYASKEKPAQGSIAASEVKRDGMVAIGAKGFESKFGDNASYKYWKWRFHVNRDNPQGTSYAVRINEIENRLKKGVSQIFVANFNQIKLLKESAHLQKILKEVRGKFVFVYLHRVRGIEELDKQFSMTTNTETNNKIRVRRKEVDKVYRQYIDNISSVDHVIINPSYLTYREDLHDQMMSLIEMYTVDYKQPTPNKMVLITGGSGVGKTYILQNKDKLGDNYEVIKKYTTRGPRNNETESAPIDLILDQPKDLVSSCDYVYSYRNELYGFNKSDIYRCFENGKTPLFVVRKMDTIKELKNDFPNLKVLYCESGFSRKDLISYLLSKGNSETDLLQRMDERFEAENMAEYKKHWGLIDYRIINDYDERFLDEIKICL